MAATATPIISKSRTTDKKVYLAQFTNVLRLGSAIAVASTVVVTLVANWLMPVLYGEEFAGAGPVLAISLWAALPTTLGTFSVNWAINEGLARVQFEKVLGMAAASAPAGPGAELRSTPHRGRAGPPAPRIVTVAR